MKVIAFGTGGTIAESGRGGWITTRELLEHDRLEIPCDVEIVEARTLSKADSSDVTAMDCVALAAEVAEATSGGGIDAILILHGTDTLADLAFLLSLWDSGSTPVAITGARTPCTQDDSDAPQQIADALEALKMVNRESRPFVIFDSELHDPMWVTKTGYGGRFEFASRPPGGPVALPIRSTHTWGTTNPGLGDSRLEWLTDHSFRESRTLLKPHRSAEFPYVPLLDPTGTAPAAFERELTSVQGPIILSGTGAGHLPEFVWSLLDAWQEAERAALVVSANGHAMGLDERYALLDRDHRLIPSPLDARRTRLVASSVLAAGGTSEGVAKTLGALWLHGHHKFDGFLTDLSDMRRG